MLTAPRLVKRYIGLCVVALVVVFFFKYEVVKHIDTPSADGWYDLDARPTQLPLDEEHEEQITEHVVVPATDIPVPTEKTKIMADKEKMRAVVDAFKHGWAAYERNAMGYDEYHPLTKRGTNFCLKGGIGYMIIDALDTIQIMGLEDEYKRARQWIADSLSFDRDENFNLFETTIRVLGGLLSAYHLSHNDTLYLEKAIDLADRLLPAFDTASGVPQAMSNLGQRVGVYDRGNGGMVSTAEATTLQLEFRYLSHISGNNTYWDKAEKVLRIVKGQTLPLGGLAPIFMQPEKGEFALTDIRLGSRGDSFYEYLLKQYIQTNQTEPVYRKMYDKTMRAVQDRLVKKSLKKGLSYTVELQANYRPNEEPWKESPKQDHLVCFLGGSLMLGTRFGGSDLVNARDWTTGEALVEGCMATHETETGLSPEIAYWRVQGDNLKDTYPNDWYIRGSRGVARGGSWTRMTSYDARYILRPETVESLFLAYRLSGDNKYREWGWRIFQSIEKYCRLESGGYASIVDVDDANSRKDDKMETFFLAETLKYLYLLFTDDTVIPLNEYVFNTEAHPLPIFTPSLDRRWLEG